MGAKFPLVKTLAVAVSFVSTCQSFTAHTSSPRNTCPLITKLSSSGRNKSVRSRSQTIRTNTNTRLNLFDSLLQKEGGSRQKTRTTSGSSLNRIPAEELEYLGNGYGMEQNNAMPPFPYTIDLLPPNSKSSNQANKLIIRHMEDEDITKVLPELVREFGALAPSLSPSPPQPGDELADKIENYLFSLTVLIGLTQRVVRRQKGYDTSNSACPDHNVICIVEQTPIINNDGANGDNGEGRISNNNIISYKEQIVGIAELCWQPPNPNSNAPPFVLPYFMKVLISRFGPSREKKMSSEDDTTLAPKGYISNVLVWKTRRGRGYSRVLMAALEGIAKLWDCDDVRLHVDANEFSGRIARSLYWGLGYEGVPDRGTSMNKKGGSFEWIGPSMAHSGLYLVDGVPLLYLRKSLKDGVN